VAISCSKWEVAPWLTARCVFLPAIMPPRKQVQPPKAATEGNQLVRYLSDTAPPSTPPADSPVAVVSESGASSSDGVRCVSCCGSTTILSSQQYGRNPFCRRCNECCSAYRIVLFANCSLELTETTRQSFAGTS
jgi:hypothetical protein